jgi:hypothetical protein
MAVSKSTLRSVSDTSQQFRGIFRASQVSEERERPWRHAVHHSEIGTPPLRSPVYEPPYNLYAQKMVDLLKEIGGTFGIGEEPSLYNQLLVQQIRSTICSRFWSTWPESNIPMYGSSRVSGRSKGRIFAIPTTSTSRFASESRNASNKGSPHPFF